MDPADAQILRSVASNLPKYDGSEGVEEFLGLFEGMFDMVGATADAKKKYLVLCLKDSARQWLQGQPSWIHWNLDQLKEALCKEYGSEGSANYVRLEQMSYKDDIYKFNQAFMKLGSTCKKACPEVM